jgi:ParB-like chromosome segregation protein Spo0J
MPADSPVHISELTSDPVNARKHTPRNIGMIVEALQEVGAARSIVIDEDGRVLAGNGTLDAAAEAGITKVQVVDADGDTIIAVRRTGLSEEKKRRLALFDNRAAELAEWSPEVIAAMQDVGTDLSKLWSEDELAEIVKDAAGSGGGGGVEEVTVSQAPVDVVWVLVGIPVEKWPQHQAAVEAMQLDAAVSTQVKRPAEASSDAE